MNDFIDETLKQSHRVESRANSLADDMAEALEAVDERIMGKLAKVAGQLDTDWENTAFKKRKKILERQRTEVESILAEVYQDKASALVSEAAQDVIQSTAKVTAKTMSALTGIEVKLGHGLSKSLVKKWFESSTVDGLLFTDWLNKLEKAAADRIVAVGCQSLIKGLGVDSAARLMRDQGIKGSVPGLRGLASTFLQSTNNYAREQTIMEHFAEVVTGWRHLGTLDGRTCLRCGPLDGKTYGLKESKPTLPLHWRCRCLYLPETGESYFREGTRAAVKEDLRIVHHRDGSTSTKFSVAEVEQVPAKTTYQSWLKGQLEKDPEFVKEVLGKGRFELFKAGKLNLNRMVSNGRIKKLSELTA